mgnify:CR=1 FL=1
MPHAPRRQWTGLRAAALCAAAALAGGVAPGAMAQDAGQGSASPLGIEAEYTTDIVAIARGQRSGVSRADYLGLAAALDLGAGLGWQGGRLYAQAIAATGGRPNDRAGTLQGINNIEVAENRLRLFQLWLEQDLPQGLGSLRLGLSDLNAEFYANDAAGLLIAPAFGIGSELAATGPNGPAIFPSTAPMARLRLEREGLGHVQAALVSAAAGVPGDRGGIGRLFGKGALAIVEAGWTGMDKGKLTFGAWAYTRRQDDIRLRTPAGDPARRRARGVYLLGEAPLAPRTIGFVRIGLSDGHTTPYAGGWQAGLLAGPALAARPDSQVSLGLNQAFVSRGYRASAAEAGEPMGRRESAIELTYADRIAPWLTVQPDVQYVRTAARGPQARDAVILTLRLQAALSRP